jgi:LysR family glycine cleavage system transcriptional activator
VRPDASQPEDVPSPHAHYLCWRTGMMDRWECAAFAEWLRKKRFLKRI